MSEEELDKAGCNICPEHMDFTVGTCDLQIIAKTYNHQKIEIVKDGNFNYELLGKTRSFFK